MPCRFAADGSRGFKLRRLSFCWLVVLLAIPLGFLNVASADEPVDFNRDIRPILSNTCYKCHGPDDKTREAGLRLDVEEGAKAQLESGAAAIVPGNIAQSAILERVTSKDESLRMPPVGSGKQLTDIQIDRLRRWIEQGAKWRGHWAFIKPQRPDLPEVRHDSWPRNGIDHFILRRLEEEGLAPQPQADKSTLIRRVTLDLTGLPPTLAEIQAFLADESPDAYEKVVNRLLQSQHYGEHMTRYWLDAARYGDTHGLHLDNVRSLWPYRDWVINAFNNNVPFDRFTVEQLAGDLLPNPTLDQKVASGFNRCNVTTSEGGSIAEEYRVRYAVDRVETTGTVWMGMTLGCAVCHEHKFDPVSQQEFYKLFDFFANMADKPMDGNALLPPPVVKVPTPKQQQSQAEYQQKLAEVQKRIREAVAAVDYQEPDSEVKPEVVWEETVWIEDGLPPGAVAQGNEGAGSWQWVAAPDHPVHSGGKSTLRTSGGLTQHFFTGAKPALEITAGDKLFAHVYLDPQNPPETIMLQFNDGKWEHRAYWGANKIAWGADNSPARRAMGELPASGEWVRLEVEAEHVGLKPGGSINGWAFTQFGGTVHWDQAGIARTSNKFDSLSAWAKVERGKKESSAPKPIQDILKLEADKRNEQQQKRLQEYFIEHVYSEMRETFTPLHKQLEAARAKLTALENSIPGTMVSEEKSDGRVPTYVLTRGQYDKPDKSQEVKADVPAVFPPLPDEMQPNRLALARWLVSPEHPLTARVTVNRYWQHYFGLGIVRTAEDFGSQGEWPSHPRLIDWLATQFIDGGWDVKAMQKLIVTSATYRQAFKVTPELQQRDPENRLLGRGPRFRLDAESIRDQALALSGLLIPKVGGESVKPYQPGGLWKAVGYTDSNTANFVQDHGAKLYRRSMYTFWKRTSPPPTMSTFDAPSRESCTVRRARTNTPLQALVLMNDVQFVEAARHFAQRIMRKGGATPQERIKFAFQSATARQPEADELQVFLDLYRANLARYQQNKAAAEKLVSVGESPRDEKLDASELAAWTMIANLILNLDEVVTKG